MFGMNLKLNQYNILLFMCFIRYGSTFIQQLCWVVCVSFCKNKKVLLLCFILLCNSRVKGLDFDEWSSKGKVLWCAIQLLPNLVFY